jgi:hypothetical protein
MSVKDLWVRYLAVGGRGDIFDIDAHLQGVLALDPYEHDTLACALNERLDELTAADHVPYLEAGHGCPSNLQAMATELLDEGEDQPHPGKQDPDAAAT